MPGKPHGCPHLGLSATRPWGVQPCQPLPQVADLAEIRTNNDTWEVWGAHRRASRDGHRMHVILDASETPARQQQAGPSIRPSRWFGSLGLSTGNLDQVWLVVLGDWMLAL